LKSSKYTICFIAALMVWGSLGCMSRRIDVKEHWFPTSPLSKDFGRKTLAVNDQILGPVEMTVHEWMVVLGYRFSTEGAMGPDCAPVRGCLLTGEQSNCLAGIAEDTVKCGRRPLQKLLLGAVATNPKGFLKYQQELAMILLGGMHRKQDVLMESADAYSRNNIVRAQSALENQYELEETIAKAEYVTTLATQGLEAASFVSSGARNHHETVGDYLASTRFAHNGSLFIGSLLLLSGAVRSGAIPVPADEKKGEEPTWIPASATPSGPGGSEAGGTGGSSAPHGKPPTDKPSSCPRSESAEDFHAKLVDVLDGLLANPTFKARLDSANPEQVMVSGMAAEAEQELQRIPEFREAVTLCGCYPEWAKAGFEKGLQETKDLNMKVLSAAMEEDLELSTALSQQAKDAKSRISTLVLVMSSAGLL
jgi:hypothetical protein